MCGIKLKSSRKDAKFCSSKCRVTFNRNKSIEGLPVTANVEAVTFKFTIKIGPNDEERGLIEAKSKVREAKYWYDVPLAAVPVFEEGWPEMPDYMNGRQYFLWWKNDFDTRDDDPIIYNPFPAYDKLTYYQAGEGSRRWGS